MGGKSFLNNYVTRADRRTRRPALRSRQAEWGCLLAFPESGEGGSAVVFKAETDEVEFCIKAPISLNLIHRKRSPCLPAGRSRRGSNTLPACYSIPRRRFATRSRGRLGFAVFSSFANLVFPVTYSFGRGNPSPTAIGCFFVGEAFRLPISSSSGFARLLIIPSPLVKAW